MNSSNAYSSIYRHPGWKAQKVPKRETVDPITGQTITTFNLDPEYLNSETGYATWIFGGGLLAVPSGKNSGSGTTYILAIDVNFNQLQNILAQTIFHRINADFPPGKPDLFGNTSLKNDDGTIQEVESNRLNELMSILEETEGKVIIWANYQLSVGEIIQKIIKVYGKDSYVHYYGLTPQEDRQDFIRKFQNDPKCRFIIGTPQTGGYGITLTQANTVIYYSNGYDLEKRLQSEDRAHRIGQKKTVTYIDLICEDTIDEKIVKALRDKINIASEVMGEELRDWI